MNKQELISMYERINNFSEYVSTEKVIKNIQQLDDRPKPVIPHFVAEIIEYYKRNNATLYDALREKNFNKQYSEWLLNEQNAYDKVAKAWLDGYEVEKEKRYTVKITKTKQYLYSRDNDFSFISYVRPDDNPHNCHTRKELEEANFGWVFDCPGIEIEEAE
ncbi:DUF1642 domain-containing protein [Streptococcus gordonii]|uniref:DUF1642 domain-containing protein n=1 Tax=Streptococcus gordonii TaxID=1302 RepID=UPI0007793CD3|nr:DUF1642 domain-containing protein [Streptococcus gordonii]